MVLQVQDGCSLKAKSMFASIKHDLAEKIWMLLFCYGKPSGAYG